LTAGVDNLTCRRSSEVISLNGSVTNAVVGDTGPATAPAGKELKDVARWMCRPGISIWRKVAG
jgi:hypothetical protein